MTLKIIGPYSSPTLYSSEPGRVYLTSSDPRIATVPEYVDVPGTVEYYNALKHGQYLAKANCLQSRDNCAFFIELHPYDIPRYNGASGANSYYVIPLVQNYNNDAYRKFNWAFALGIWYASATTQICRLHYIQSADSANSELAYIPYNSSYTSDSTNPIRYLIEFSGTAYRLYTSNGTTPVASAARAVTTGTMGGSEYLAMMHTMRKFAKMESLPTEAQRIAFCTNGTIPTGCACAYVGGHEIVESAPVFWDSAGINDLSAVNVTGRPPAAASGTRVDSVTVEPWQSINLTPISSGAVTITATRRRAGVPDRASTVEKYETTTADFSVSITSGKDFNRMQSVVLANHAGLEPVEDMTIAFRALVTSLPTAATKMIDCGVGADDLLSSWQVILNPAGTLTLGGMSGSSYVSVTSSLTLSAGVETAVILKKDGTSIDLTIGDNTETLTLATDWDYWSSDVTVRIGDVGFSGAVWDLYTFTRLIAASEITKFKAGYRVSNYAYHNSLQIQDGKISGGYVSGFLDL